MPEDTFKKFRVMMKIEIDGPAESDPEIEKSVIALSVNDALDQARALVKRENPEVNYSKIWFWTIQRIFD